MAITVDYTPMGEVGRLATQAGMNQAAQREQEMRQQKDLMQIQNQMEQANMLFQQQAQQQARAEEAGYQMKFIAAKRDIDIQMELQGYQRDREKLNMNLDMIRDADYLSPQEKEELVLQATSKYSGGNVSAANFTQKLDPLQRKILESTVRSNVANQLMAAVNAGDMTSEEAEFQYSASGYGKLSFSSPGEVSSEKEAALVADLAKVQAAFDRTFAMDGENILNKKTSAKVKKGTPEYSTATSLLAVINKKTKALDEFSQKGIVEEQEIAEFNNYISTSAGQSLIKKYGAEQTFKAWKARKEQGDNWSAIGISSKVFGEPKKTKTDFSSSGNYMGLRGY